MRVIFGRFLDGPRYPLIPGGKDAVVGETYCGPHGLLSLLESRLGLHANRQPFSYRVELFRQRLLAADSEDTFYHQSLGADSVAVAETLLDWRDALALGGWDFKVRKAMPKRLRDLATVERITSPMPPGIVERLRAVIDAVPTANVGIASIELTEAIERLGRPWGEILLKLRERGVAIVPPSQGIIRASGDLGQLQTSLLQGGHAKAVGDGSVVVLAADTDTYAGDVLGTWLSTVSALDKVLIVPHGDKTLARILANYGMPSVGVASLSPSIPVLQVLPLLLELLWAPLNPYRLLEFLMLPETPIPMPVARRLAENVAVAPGIGGEGWREKVREAKAVFAGQGERGAALENVEELIRGWLEGPRYSQQPGAPRDAVCRLVRRIRDWAGKGGKHDGANGLMALAEKAEQLFRTLEISSESHLTRPHLQSIMRLIQRDWAPIAAAGEAGHIPWVERPGAIIGEASDVIWWGATSGGTGNCIPQLPLTVDESRFLSQHGVQLESQQDDLALARAGVERAVLNVRKRLILVVPKREQGRDAFPLPFINRIKVIFQDSYKNVVVSAPEWLNGCLLLPSVDTSPIVSRKLPKLQRVWRLPKDVSLPARDVESYSSLHDLFYAPFRWVLRHKARIKAGCSYGIADIKTVMGNVAHQIFRQVFIPGETFSQWTDARMEWVIKEVISEIVAQEGAVLLLPGYETERNSFTRRVIAAASRLARHISENRWRVAGAELPVEGMLGAQPVAGRIDLLLEDGTRGVIDLKWGGGKYRAEELAGNRALQLALYAHMVARGSWDTRVAYFIISEAALIAPDRAGFVNAVVMAPKAANWLPLLVEQMARTLLWRREQLDAGIIEVPVAGTIPDPALSALEEGLVVPDGEPAEYLALVGWKEAANG